MPALRFVFLVILSLAGIALAGAMLVWPATVLWVLCQLAVIVVTAWAVFLICINQRELWFIQYDTMLPAVDERLIQHLQLLLVLSIGTWLYCLCQSWRSGQYSLLSGLGWLLPQLALPWPFILAQCRLIERGWACQLARRTADQSSVTQPSVESLTFPPPISLSLEPV